jgi:DNA-binding CsgD family transcriptional regulator
MIKLKKRATFVSRRLGQAGMVLFTGLSGGEFLENCGDQMSVEEFLGNPLALLYLGAAFLFLASARFAVLRTAQPVLLLAMVPIQTIAGSGVLGGLGFALASALIFLRLGFFKSRGLVKASVLSAAVAAAELGAVFLASHPRALAGPALSCAAIFCLLSHAMAKRKILAVLAPRREALSLGDFELSARELQFLSGRLEGKTSKEIGFEFGVTDSTVRNTLMSAYRKLGIHDARELGAMAERYTFKAILNIERHAKRSRNRAKKAAKCGAKRPEIDMRKSRT